VSTVQPPPRQSRELEDEYRAHRDAVLAMLRAAFGTLVDPEEVYQEAWAETLALRARGKRVENLRGLLKTIAWRRARDRLRRPRPEPIDPSRAALASEPDPDVDPGARAEIHVDAAALRQVIDALEPRQAAVLKLRFDWQLEAREIQERLGVTAKRLEKIFSEAYKQVQAYLAPTASGESAWRRRQRSLLLACETGIATPEQRARAQTMVEQDPVCRAMLAEMRARLEQLSAALPVPVLAGDDRLRGLTGGTQRVADALATVKEQIIGVLGRTGGHGLTLEQAGGGAGILGGSATAAKIGLACLATAAGTAACLETGLLGGEHRVKKSPRAEARHQRPARKPARIHVVRYVASQPTPRPPAPRRVRRREAPKPPPSPTGPAPASPAPAGSTEFGPGSVGSQPASKTPAPAPQTGGGEFTP